MEWVSGAGFKGCGREGGRRERQGGREGLGWVGEREGQRWVNTGLAYLVGEGLAKASVGAQHGVGRALDPSAFTREHGGRHAYTSLVETGGKVGRGQGRLEGRDTGSGNGSEESDILALAMNKTVR